MPADPLQPVRDAIVGLDYPSESDSPFELVDWPKLSLPAGTVTESPESEFFDPLATVNDAGRFAKLRAVLQALVHPLRYFRIDDGSAEVKIFLVGQTAGRRVVGVGTVSVET